MQDPVTYTVEITHWQDGELNVRVLGVGDNDADRAAIVYALKEAIHLVEVGKSTMLTDFN